MAHWSLWACWTHILSVRPTGQSKSYQGFTIIAMLVLFILYSLGMICRN